MIRCVFLAAVVLAGGCATRRPPQANVEQLCPPLWHGPIRFVEDGAAFAPIFERTLAMATRPSASCEIQGIQVVGLPAPEVDDRSAAVRDALIRLGLPEPVFSAGDTRAERHPFITIEAERR